jgi:hypothetical protein
MVALRNTFPQISSDSRPSSDAHFEWLLCIASALQASQRLALTAAKSRQQKRQEPGERRRTINDVQRSVFGKFRNGPLLPMWHVALRQLRLMPSRVGWTKHRDAA